ncbi:MAG: hypothetical protein ACR2QO_17530 [Acidimicrobiales bacterium]
MRVRTTPGQGPLLAEVDRIAAISDPRARNLRITQLYHELELALGQLLAGEDLAWCAYGVWASKQVGAAMDGLPVDHVRSLLTSTEFVDSLPLLAPDERWVRSGLRLAARTPDRVLAWLLDNTQPRIAEALGQGNRRVFTELAPTFAGFLDLAHETGGDPKEMKLQLPALYAALGHATFPGGMGYELTLACEYYTQALESDDSHERAQLIYYANLRAAHYEQQRVQGPLEELTDAILETPASLVGQRRVVAALVSVLERVAPRRVHRLRYTLGLVLGRMVTDLAVRVETPIDSLAVGTPLKPDAEGNYYPESLAELTVPAFKEFFKHPNNWMQLGPNPETEIVAFNWINYHERMPFIAHMMRMRQQSAALRIPPSVAV